jgi:hypothetical protein
MSKNKFSKSEFLHLNSDENFSDTVHFVPYSKRAGQSCSN